MRLLATALMFVGTGLAVAAGCSEDEGGGDGGGTTSTTGVTTSDGGAGAGGQGGSGASGACSPQPLDSFTPTWTPPEAIYQERCTDAEVDGLVDDCFNGTTAACDAAKAAAADCWDCLLSDYSDSTWGPIFDASAELGFVDRNWPGCVAHAEGDLSANGCGAKAAAYWDCRHASCAECLPVSAFTFNEDLAALNACGTAATQEGAPCESYAEELETCAATLSGPIADQCDWTGGSLLDVFKRYGKLFCASEPR